MALTQVPIELSSTPGIVDNSNATAITIDSSENVGIGTDSPSKKLVISDGGAMGVEISPDDSGNGYSRIINYDRTTNQYEPLRIEGEILQFSTGTTATEKARLDASGNLLVGKTATAVSSDGVEVRNNGLLVATRDSNKAAILNRRSSDGDILAIYKSGSPVGSIGTNSSLIYFAGTSIGLKISGTQIRPSNSTGANNDNAVDLGKSDTRFKDLYLSGGAYLGGTAAANYLDDYEEGTWTPVGQNINGSGYNIGVADYTKVGRLVSCDLRVQWTGTANTAASIGFTLPFQSDNTTDAARTGLVFFSGTQIFGDAAISTHISNNGNVVSFYKTNGGNFQTVSSNQVNGTYDWLVSFTYFTA